MVFIKVRSCSTRPAFPPVAPFSFPPRPSLSLPPFPRPFFFFFSLRSSFAAADEEVGETVEAPLANERQNEKVRFFDVINLGMAVTRNDGRGFVAYQNR